MKIMFIDLMGLAYDTTTPFKAPMGGTQSAVAYLSKELAALGNQVTVINGVPEPRESDGVHFTCLPCPTEIMNEFDVIVVVAAAIGQTIRGLGVTRPMILWCHHAADQSAVQSLADPAERACFQGYATVSHWQAMGYMSAFDLPGDQIRILRNAASPMVSAVPTKPAWYDRGTPPTLAYSSTPFRGLDILLMAFPMIRTMVPDVRLRVYSSMGIYGQTSTEDQFTALYELARALPGVEYVGPLPQAQLAEALADVDYLTYPSTFAETSCIAVIEALSVGAHVISTGLGALPETTAGFATLVDAAHPHPIMFASKYATTVAETINGLNRDEDRERRTNQIKIAREVYTWSERAKTWQGWLEEVSRNHG